jgi:cytochrome bd-type quinol oxidase subunit 2
MLGSQVFNALESGLWLVMAVGCGLGSVRCADRYRRTLLVAAAVFLAFGVSDVLEIQTARKGMPWWLWAIKIVCVLTLAGCYLAYRRIRSRAA